MKDSRTQAAITAQEWLDQEPLFLDTETTGLDDSAEIVEIAILNTSGKPLLDTLIKPTRPIPRAATKIHSITNSDVTNAPTFADITPELRRLIDGRLIVIYNAQYDIRMLAQSARARGVEESPVTSGVCAMNLYATFYGKWNNYRGSYKWQSLINAARQCGIKAPNNLHRAAGDADLTRLIVQHMAENV
jgi:DNA polymerase-3 subunit epsilon